jgi:GNAT superfamily N-acetyltransferase
MAIEIKEIKSNKELKRFVGFLYGLYIDHPYFIPPLCVDEMETLRKNKNPAFEFCDSRLIMVYKDGLPAGRIAGIINHRYNEKWNQKHARFGWLDFIDDEEVVDALFADIEGWARDKGMTALLGPLGFTDLDREGMLIEGFDELGTMATYYNHPYYPEHMKRLGFEKEADWVEYFVTVPNEIPERIGKLSEVVTKRYKLQVLPNKTAKELKPYARELFYLLNQSYEELFGFVPLTDKQIDLYTKQYIGYIKKGFLPLVLAEDGKMIAFAVAMPSLSRALQKSKGKLLPLGIFHMLKAMKKNDLVDLYLVAVRPDFQGKGVNAILIHELWKIFRKHRIQWAESNVELEDNIKVRSQWDYFKSRQHKRRRCFIKSL